MFEAWHIALVVLLALGCSVALAATKRTLAPPAAPPIPTPRSTALTQQQLITALAKALLVEMRDEAARNN